MIYLIYSSVSLPKSGHLLLSVLKSLIVLSIRMQGELKLQSGEHKEPGGLCTWICSHALSHPLWASQGLGIPCPLLWGRVLKPPVPLPVM